MAFRLGHASTAMIERHYGELGEGFDREIADRLSAARSKQGGSARHRPVSPLVATAVLETEPQATGMTSIHLGLNAMHLLRSVGCVKNSRVFTRRQFG